MSTYIKHTRTGMLFEESQSRLQVLLSRDIIQSVDRCLMHISVRLLHCLALVLVGTLTMNMCQA